MGYCEKDGTKGLSKVKNADGSLAHPMKKTWYDACVVGDTVGDPFKDTSGPALSILIKLMSMVSLTIAPLLKTYDKHWEFYYWGFPPLGLFVILTAALVYTGILTWEDPIGKTTLKDYIIMASNGEPIPPHMDVIPDSNKCVAISTKSSVREMIAPGAYAILAPLFVGFLVGPRCLVGMLAGGIGSGAMVAIMMSNAGGAWDNAKKYCEKDGTKGLSKVKNADGTLAHPMKKTWYDACVVGDTVGDPFKDTSGPALNILIKLMSMVSLTIAPLLKTYDKHWEFYYWGFP